jgi:antitoxin component YwqK of YwqJK toxin-antitoxin module
MAHRLLPLLLALSAPATLAGCMAYSNVKRDTDRHPIVHTGVGATILMPGQSAPALPQSMMNAQRYGSASGGPTQGSSSGSGSGFGSGTGSGGGAPQAGGQPGAPQGGAYAGGPGAPAPGSGTNIQFSGGTELEEVTHREIRQDPLIMKTLLAPVAMVAYPFKKAYEALQGDPEEVKTPPPQQAAPRGPTDYQGAYEQSQLDQLEQQLGPQGAQRSAVQAAPPYPAPQVASAPPSGGASSISDELALLQRRVQPRSPAGEGAGGPPALAGQPTPNGVADKVADRNGDGRPDHWEYRANGALVRELFDEDGDGRVDHTIRYDAASGKKASEEEDSDVDGRIDSWVEYRNGEVVRRRQDANHDGEPDAWTMYSGGQLARVEEDRNGDGFRDRVGYYSAGKLRREVEDANGDGRPDRVTLYDANERASERTEDLNGDGMIDARSFFEKGKLVRRELVDEGTAAPLVEEERLDTPEGFSDGNEAVPQPGGDQG